MKFDDSTLDRAEGCLLGALIGDAAGGTLEFIGRRPTGAEVAQAMTMCGGGVFGLAPGQITDDGELSISLARALVGAQSYPRERVANHYRAWLQSRPFDIGNTIQNALSISIDFGESSADAIQSLAASKNQTSKSNGALMRSTPLGIWSTRVSEAAAVDSALVDALLTHPDSTCGWASAAYVVAIRHLLLNHGDQRGAFQSAVDVVDSNSDKGASTVRTWLTEASSGKLPLCYPQPGFVGIAFTHAFYHLLYARSYEAGLHSVLVEGGDTDTNACIVGGLLGARFGLASIPNHMAAAVENCDVASGRIRPTWLRASDVLKLCTALVDGRKGLGIAYTTTELPKKPVHLGLEASFPASSRDSIERGFEGLTQDDKWAVCFQPPLVQIWRRRTTGVYSFAVLLSSRPDGSIYARDSWVSKTLIEDWGFSMEECKKMASFVLGACAGHSAADESFSSSRISGQRFNDRVSFSGEAFTDEDVDEIALLLKQELSRRKR